MRQVFKHLNNLNKSINLHKISKKRIKQVNFQENNSLNIGNFSEKLNQKIVT